VKPERFRACRAKLDSLGINDRRSIARYASGKKPIPDGIAELVELLVATLEEWHRRNPPPQKSAEPNVWREAMEAFWNDEGDRSDA